MRAANPSSAEGNNRGRKNHLGGRAETVQQDGDERASGDRSFLPINSPEICFIQGDPTVYTSKPAV
jgi:hypothetical protein